MKRRIKIRELENARIMRKIDKLSRLAKHRAVTRDFEITRMARKMGNELIKR